MSTCVNMYIDICKCLSVLATHISICIYSIVDVCIYLCVYTYICISAQAGVWHAYVVLAHEYVTRHICNMHCIEIAW